MREISALDEKILELVRRASSQLPPDVVAALKRGLEREEPNSGACAALKTVLKNIDLAAEKSTPICQDTGTPTFYISHPWDYPSYKIKQAAEKAVQKATELNYLRPNAVDSVTGENSGDNTGIYYPVFYFEEWDKPELKISLMLKGGGCENVGAQYSLPYSPLKAGRDLKGVRAVILDAVIKAQGKGCSPGILGICIGGDRATGYALAKKQLLRKLDDLNPDPVLAQLEGEILEEANQLGIGPMGFGGATTLLGVKITKAHRLPASFFVSISYMCWASRRKTMTIKGEEVSYD